MTAVVVAAPPVAHDPRVPPPVPDEQQKLRKKRGGNKKKRLKMNEREIGCCENLLRRCASFETRKTQIDGRGNVSNRRNGRWRRKDAERPRRKRRGRNERQRYERSASCSP